MDKVPLLITNIPDSYPIQNERDDDQDSTGNVGVELTNKTIQNVFIV